MPAGQPTPGPTPLWTDYLEHLGESTLIGSYPAGTQLVLGLKPASYCAGATPRPSTGASARIAAQATGVWDVWWEDWNPLRRTSMT